VILPAGKFRTNYVQKSAYDLIGAVLRQQNFNYQISLPHYTSPKFISEAVHRYYKFLFLKIHYPDQFLTPCYDFDLVWHSHQVKHLISKCNVWTTCKLKTNLQVHPIIYSQDTQRLLGKMLKHDDSVGDRSAHSKLLRGEALTKWLWQHHFGTDQFWRRGSMYRGHEAPQLIGFAHQHLSDASYGHVRIPCITLKDIPVQRDNLKLKLSYGSKKVIIDTYTVGFSI